jgi:hypothetical protein
MFRKCSGTLFILAGSTGKGKNDRRQSSQTQSSLASIPSSGKLAPNQISFFNIFLGDSLVYLIDSF